MWPAQLQPRPRAEAERPRWRPAYGIGEPPPVVMQELGHTDPALALSIYAHAMRRDDGENERLRALVEGADLALRADVDHPVPV